MKKITLTFIALIFLLIVVAISVRPIGMFCDDTLKSKVNSSLIELRTLGDVKRAGQIFSNSGAIISEITNDACPDHYGNLAEVACRGGSVLIAELEAKPLYCSWSGSGPAKVSFHYNTQKTSAEVFTRLPKSILSNNIFSVFFGKE